MQERREIERIIRIPSGFRSAPELPTPYRSKSGSCVNNLAESKRRPLRSFTTTSRIVLSHNRPINGMTFRTTERPDLNCCSYG
jgi:hypothetical protein